MIPPRPSVPAAFGAKEVNAYISFLDRYTNEYIALARDAVKTNSLDKLNAFVAKHRVEFAAKEEAAVAKLTDAERPRYSSYVSPQLARITAASNAAKKARAEYLANKPPATPPVVIAGVTIPPAPPVPATFGAKEVNDYIAFLGRYADDFVAAAKDTDKTGSMDKLNALIAKHRTESGTMEEAAVAKLTDTERSRYSKYVSPQLARITAASNAAKKARAEFLANKPPVTPPKPPTQPAQPAQPPATTPPTPPAQPAPPKSGSNIVTFVKPAIVNGVAMTVSDIWTFTGLGPNVPNNAQVTTITNKTSYRIRISLDGKPPLVFLNPGQSTNDFSGRSGHLPWLINGPVNENDPRGKPTIQFSWQVK